MTVGIDDKPRSKYIQDISIRPFAVALRNEFFTYL